MNELSIVIFMVIAGALWALMAYSVGFKQGEREGFLKGRAISRHASSREFYALPSDVKEVN
jgi:hypothetical protein